MNSPCFSLRQYRDRDQDRQNRNDAELEAAREADSFSCGLKPARFNTRFNAAHNQGAKMNQVMRQLPRYACHKQVWALKIASIVFDSDQAHAEDRESDGSATITPAESGYAPFKVDAEYVRKHNPQAGGYYVVYDDGYKSFSPAEAFESGYTNIDPVSICEPDGQMKKK